MMIIISGLGKEPPGGTPTHPTPGKGGAGGSKVGEGPKWGGGQKSPPPPPNTIRVKN